MSIASIVPIPTLLKHTFPNMPHLRFTLETAYALTKHTALEPLLVAPILWGLERYPDLSRAWLSKTMANVPTDWVKSTLWALLGLGFLRRINEILSQASLNHYTRDSYDWRREIVVVTGGSGGLGDVLVRKLAKHGIKVINVDIVPPKTPLRMLYSPLTLCFCI
jgi:all-trans-retinol dehydrogenase (NAD+)